MNSSSRPPLFSKFINLVETVCASGIRALSDEERMLFVTRKSPEVVAKFQMALFESWKRAQVDILVMQLGLYRLAIEEKQPLGRYLFQNSQRLMDTIVWHNYGGGDYTDIKRLYDWNPRIQNLKEHNIDLHCEVAERINEDPRKFALLSDLTSGLRLGDLLVFEVGKRPIFAEVKEGSINRQILDSFHNGSKLPEDFLSDPRKIKQIERMVRQSNRAQQTFKLLHENEGEDDRYPGMKYTIREIEKPQEKFNTEMERVIELVEGSGQPQTAVVEDCLLLIALRTNKERMVPVSVVREAIKKFETNSEISGVSFDWGHVLTDSSILRPLFIQELPSQMIQSLVCREVVVVVYLSFERFCKKFSTEKFEVFPVIGKQRNKVVGRSRSEGGGGVWNKKSALAYRFRNGPAEVFSDGIFGRIPSFLVNPSYFLYMQQCTAELMEKLKMEKDEK